MKSLVPPLHTKLIDIISSDTLVIITSFKVGLCLRIGTLWIGRQPTKNNKNQTLSPGNIQRVDNKWFFTDIRQKGTLKMYRGLLCTMVVPARLYQSIPLSVTVTLVQCYSGVRRLKLKVLFLCEVESHYVKCLWNVWTRVYMWRSIWRWWLFKGDNCLLTRQKPLCCFLFFYLLRASCSGYINLCMELILLKR